MKVAATFAVLAAVSAVTCAQEIVLGCQGSSYREESAGVRRMVPVIAEVRIELGTGTMKIAGLSCWAGRGDCSRLPARISETSFSAAGDGLLLKTGMSTTISIDRRSGYMKMSQGKDISSSQTQVAGPQSEEAELICSGSSKPRF